MVIGSDINALKFQKRIYNLYDYPILPSVIELVFYLQWRDHWMQAVYFFKRPLCVQEGSGRSQ